MSMWEVEGLVEESVCLVDSSTKPSREKRELLRNLYLLQAAFDTSFTHFRLMDILLKNGYALTMPMEEHPEYAMHEAYFEKLAKRDFDFVNPTGEWDEEDTLPAYWDQKTGLVYYDYGSPLWQHLNRMEPIEELMNEYALGFAMIHEADRQKDAALVYDWTAFMLNYFHEYFPSKLSVEELIDTYYKKIKVIWSQYDHSDYERKHEGLTIHDEETDWFSPEQNRLIGFFRQAG